MGICVLLIKKIGLGFCYSNIIKIIYLLTLAFIIITILFDETLVIEDKCDDE